MPRAHAWLVVCAHHVRSHRGYLIRGAPSGRCNKHCRNASIPSLILTYIYVCIHTYAHVYYWSFLHTYVHSYMHATMAVNVNSHSLGLQTKQQLPCKNVCGVAHMQRENDRISVGRNWSGPQRHCHRVLSCEGPGLKPVSGQLSEQRVQH